MANPLPFMPGELLPHLLKFMGDFTPQYHVPISPATEQWVMDAANKSIQELYLFYRKKIEEINELLSQPEFLSLFQSGLQEIPQPCSPEKIPTIQELKHLHEDFLGFFVGNVFHFYPDFSKRAESLLKKEWSSFIDKKLRTIYNTLFLNIQKIPLDTDKEAHQNQTLRLTDILKPFLKNDMSWHDPTIPPPILRMGRLEELPGYYQRQPLENQKSYLWDLFSHNDPLPVFWQFLQNAPREKGWKDCLPFLPYGAKFWLFLYKGLKEKKIPYTQWPDIFGELILIYPNQNILWGLFYETLQNDCVNHMDPALLARVLFSRTDAPHPDNSTLNNLLSEERTATQNSHFLAVWLRTTGYKKALSFTTSRFGSFSYTFFDPLVQNRFVLDSFFPLFLKWIFIPDVLATIIFIQDLDKNSLKKYLLKIPPQIFQENVATLPPDLRELWETYWEFIRTEPVYPQTLLSLLHNIDPRDPTLSPIATLLLSLLNWDSNSNLFLATYLWEHGVPRILARLHVEQLKSLCPTSDRGDIKFCQEIWLQILQMATPYLTVEDLETLYNHMESQCTGYDNTLLKNPQPWIDMVFSLLPRDPREAQQTLVSIMHENMRFSIELLVTAWITKRDPNLDSLQRDLATIYASPSYKGSSTRVMRKSYPLLSRIDSSAFAWILSREQLQKVFFGFPSPYGKGYIHACQQAFSPSTQTPPSRPAPQTPPKTWRAVCWNFCCRSIQTVWNWAKSLLSFGRRILRGQ